ncbi:MAG TPA: polysaccharide biosynthesis tyrosine autokinase [Ktedonobacteraceae bacterium]|nr:polysaccharide biosynthesis tyrosine autokinase [Ktedonobacteraceae bacterium]
MGNTFKHMVLITRHWIWLFVAGAVLCGSAAYAISTFVRPVYQASAYLIINIGTSTHPSITESLQAVPTFAQLITTPAVLAPVVAQHPGMNMQDLLAMLTVKPQANTQIIELDVQAGNPRLAAELANQVSQSFAQYANSSAPDTVQLMLAQTPALPAQPRPLEDAGIGAVVGLLLAIMLSMLFEWISNRVSSVEQIQELLNVEIMTLVPHIPRKARLTDTWQATAEKYHMISASLNLAQTSQPFKLVMFTSALAGEGKSTIISQVAMDLAQANKKVLLVDLNIHRPALAQQFHLQSQQGLTNWLVRGNKHFQIEEYSQASEIAGLYVLSAGTQRMNSAEFLQALTTTHAFEQLKQTSFDYILLDAPPLFAVADTQLLLPALEAMVLVVNSARTPRRVLARTRQILWRLQKTRVLGVIVNQSPWREYTDSHSYLLPQARQYEVSQQFKIEQVTTDLPELITQLPPALPAPQPVSVARQPYFPNTGETEPVRPTYVIRPMLSLSGLTMSGNGLTRRIFDADISTPVPPSLHDISS